MAEAEREELNLVVVGHVDHGKSTIIGRMLADTHSLPEGKLAAVQENCRRNARPFEYAFLLDALKEEQSQGITIDVARCFFKTAKRNYILIDAPGHIEFLKNMVTGASWAEAALLVIDASEGVRENSRRHGYMLSMLGIRQVAVLVNKMDLVDYDEGVYRQIVDEYSHFLGQIGLTPAAFLPVSGRMGDNVAAASARLPWYTGGSVVEQIDAFVPESTPEDRPLRLPVQDVYKFTRDGDSRRIVAGRIEAGRLRVGDEVVFYPSGKKSVVHSIEAFNQTTPLQQQAAPWSVGFTLEEQIYVRRGEVAALAGQPKPCTTDRLRANLFWLGKEPLQPGKKYLFKINTVRVEMEVESILRVIDASNLEQKQVGRVERNEVAECILKLEQTAAFDLAADLPETGRFVIVDEYEIAGGGIVIEALDEPHKSLSQKVQRRNIHWESPSISEMERAERYNQKSCLILVTGAATDGLRKQVAKSLEKQLFQDGKFVYFLGMGSLLYGVSADIKNGHPDPDEVEAEYFRRLAEVANLMMDAGLILVVSTRELRPADVKVLETALADRAERIFTVWAGDTVTTSLRPHLHLKAEDCPDGAHKIKELLQRQDVIFNPWKA
ncbi:MAG: adenylyl-sulfate kinase [Chloroflexi bacterium]|nr:adenylyl-sulfate kinase [Chloroflexota bacterium]